MSSPNDDAARLAEIRSRWEADAAIAYFEYPQIFDDIRFLLPLLDAQQAEVERLREALYHYGEHGGTCLGHRPEQDCTCGLSALLKGGNQ